MLRVSGSSFRQTIKRWWTLSAKLVSKAWKLLSTGKMNIPSFFRVESCLGNRSPIHQPPMRNHKAVRYFLWVKDGGFWRYNMLRLTKKVYKAGNTWVMCRRQRRDAIELWGAWGKQVVGNDSGAMAKGPFSGEWFGSDKMAWDWLVKLGSWPIFVPHR